MTEPSSYDIAARAGVASRLFELDLARAAAVDGDDAHLDLFHEWLHGLPLPPEGSAARPLRSVGISITAALDRVTCRAMGAPDEMIEPAADLFRAVDAPAGEVAALTRFGGVIEPAAFGTWLETSGPTLNAGWEMSGGLDTGAALTVFEDPGHRRTLESFASTHPGSRVASVARSVGAGAVTTRALFEVGPASDDNVVAAVTRLLADLDAPSIDDRTLGVMLAEAGDRLLALSLWALADGFGRVGFAIAEPPMPMVIALVTHGGWVDSLDRLAAVQAALDAEHPARIECFVAASGNGAELFYELALP